MSVQKQPKHSTKSIGLENQLSSANDCYLKVGISEEALGHYYEEKVGQHNRQDTKAFLWRAGNAKQLKQFDGDMRHASRLLLSEKIHLEQ